MRDTCAVVPYDGDVTTTTPPPKLVADPAAIQRLRYERGYNTTQLASRAGLSRPAMSRIENGRLAGSPSSLKRIADALGVSVAAITMTKPADTG